jgi:UDP-N-acetyl-2-amino-2-deoxyglucuronate dehydrogenase
VIKVIDIIAPRKPPNIIEQWEFTDKQDYDDEVDQSNTNPTSVYGFGHVGYYRNVINTLQGINDAVSDGLEGRKSLNLLEQIYQNIR